MSGPAIEMTNKELVVKYSNLKAKWPDCQCDTIANRFQEVMAELLKRTIITTIEDEDQIILDKAELTLEFLGTCCEKHYPRECCICEQCQDKTNAKRKHSLVLVNGSTLIDCGSDHLPYLSDYGATAVILTHVHCDNSGAAPLFEGEIYCTKDVADGLQIENYNEIIPGKEQTINGIKYKFVEIKHTEESSCIAIIIKGKVFYSTDILDVDKKELEGIKTYIGDGSTLERPIERDVDGKAGHASMIDQIEWCEEAGIKNIYFTHIGHTRMNHKNLNDYLKVYGAEALKDGDKLTGTKLLKMGVSKAFWKVNKPAYRMYEWDDIKDFDLGENLYVGRKYDGMRIQTQKINGKVKFYSDSGNDLTKMLPKQQEEEEKAEGDNWIKDGEALMVKDGKILHRVDAIGALMSEKYTGETDDIVIYNFDVLKYEDKDVRDDVLEDRLTYLEEFKDGDHIKHERPDEDLKKKNDCYITHNREDAKKACDKVMEYEGSEGAIIKDLESKYKKETTQNQGWVKWKNYHEIDGLVIDKREVGEDKTMRSYKIACGPIDTDWAEGIGDRAVKYGGEYYMDLGRPLNTKIDVRKHSILRVAVSEIKESDEDGFPLYTLYLARVLYPVEDKDVPDKMEVVERIAKLTKPSEKAIDKDKEEELAELDIEPGQPYPEKYYTTPKKLPDDKQHKFVLQNHTGHDISDHRDLRFQVSAKHGDPLIGWTLFTDTDKFNEWLKGKRPLRAIVKKPQPYPWLTLDGELKPGSPGAREETGAKLSIIDTGAYEMGCQRKDMHEYFLYGDKNKVVGRILFRLITSSQGNKIWLCYFPQDQMALNPLEDDDGDWDINKYDTGEDVH